MPKKVFDDSGCNPGTVACVGTVKRQKFRIAAMVFSGMFAMSVCLSGKEAKATPDPLWETFRNPPMEARASCFWWWKGDLAAGEMERQLHLLKEAGLGGAHIIPWGKSKPVYLSPEWLGLLGVTADAAKREGMILDLSACAMWPFRGNWVPEEESLFKVEAKVIPLEGPRKFSAAEIFGKMAGTKTKTGNKADSRLLLVQLAPDPLTDIAQMRDVTADLKGKDPTGIEVPAGKHTLRVVSEMSDVKSDPELGRVPDHFNVKAMENYLNGLSARLAPALGGKLGNGLRAMFCDSIEIGESNWTPGLPAEFKRRCGYDLMPYLSLVLRMEPQKQANGSGPLEAMVSRVRYDYCRTMVDMFLDGTARPFQHWCRENGVLCRLQVYGWPMFYGIEDGYRIPDMPEGNNWLYSHGDPDTHGWPVWQKFASSGGHQTGRRIVSTEAMTVTDGKFQETLDQVKRADDFNFVCGITYSFLHGFCYSPVNEPFPGRNQYGTFFGEQNTWWPYMRRWTDYNARLSAVFQASRPVAQVALLFRTGDVWSQAALSRAPYQTDPPWAHQVWRWINQNGANADYVSDEVLRQATFADGQIDFGPMRYDALIVLGARTLVPGTAEALERYAQAGGKIVFLGGAPTSSPGLQDAVANDRKVKEIIQELLRKYPRTVIVREPPGALPSQSGGAAQSMDQWLKSTTPAQCLAWTDQLLTDLAIPRSVQFEKPVPGLYQIQYRSDEGRDLYFFVNTTPGDIAAQASLPVAGKHMERWDPETGARSVFPVDKDGFFPVTLPPAGSLLLVTASDGAPPASDFKMPSGQMVVQKVDGPWSVSFKSADGNAFEISPFKLVGFDGSDDRRLNRFSGQAVYRTSFTWDKPADKGVYLDLGAVPNGITEVTLNGSPLGVRWYGRHDYAVDGFLKQGENRLEVKVVTTLFNRLRKDTEKPISSGLLGPVTLQTDIKNDTYPK